MRWAAIALCLCASSAARADKLAIRCEDAATADVAVDGMLDEWKHAPAARVAGLTVHCAWDGAALALALDIADDKVVRVRSGKAHEDHVDVTVGAGGTPVALSVYPGNALAPARVRAPAKVQVADSLQPRGYAIEALIPAARIAGFSGSTPALDLHVVVHDSDAATGGADTELALDATIELTDRKTLLDDFLATVRLKKTDLRIDQLAELDPDRKGKERLVAGGTVIGVLTDQYAYVSLPAQSAADVREVTLLPLGPRGQQVIAAVVHQRDPGGHGGRDLLMLWVVWSGQLSPIAQIEIRKEQGAAALASDWKIARGELVVTPKPAVGATAETWPDQIVDDADAIVPPWDPVRGGVAYKLHGADVIRRDLPAPRRKK